MSWLGFCIQITHDQGEEGATLQPAKSSPVLSRLEQRKLLGNFHAKQREETRDDDAGTKHGAIIKVFVFMSEKFINVCLWFVLVSCNCNYDTQVGLCPV